MKFTRGFTLMELLVVISIIALLAVMLLASVKLVRSAAQELTCANGLRQCGLAMNGWGLDNQGFVPDVRGAAGWSNVVRDILYQGAPPGTARSDIRNGCPLYLNSAIRKFYLSLGINYPGYGMNGWLARDGSATNGQQHCYPGYPNYGYPAATQFTWGTISHPGTRLLLADCDEDWTGTNRPGLEPSIFAVRHRAATMSMLFCDLRVERRSKADARIAARTPQLLR